MLVALYAIGDIDDMIWISLFPYRFRPQLPGHPFIPSKDTRPLETFCSGFKLRSIGSCNSNEVLKFCVDIDPSTCKPYYEQCSHDTCDSFSSFKFALYSAYSKGYIQGLNPRTSMHCPKFIINTLGWKKLFCEVPCYKNFLLNKAMHPVNTLNRTFHRLLFNPSSFVKSIPDQRFEPKIEISTIIQTQDARRISTDELSEDSSSDEDESDCVFAEYNLHLDTPLDKCEPTVTLRLTYDKDPKIILNEIKNDKNFPYGLSSFCKRSCCQEPSNPQNLILNLRNESKMLLDFLIHAIAEKGNSEFRREIKNLLEVGIQKLTDPYSIFANRIVTKRLQ